jgi:hypothetical protein
VDRKKREGGRGRGRALLCACVHEQAAVFGRERGRACVCVCVCAGVEQWPSTGVWRSIDIKLGRRPAARCAAPAALDALRRPAVVFRRTPAGTEVGGGSVPTGA